MHSKKITSVKSISLILGLFFSFSCFSAVGECSKNFATSAKSTKSVNLDLNQTNKIKNTTTKPIKKQKSSHNNIGILRLVIPQNSKD